MAVMAAGDGAGVGAGGSGSTLIDSSGIPSLGPPLPSAVLTTARIAAATTRLMPASPLVGRFVTLHAVADDEALRPWLPRLCAAMNGGAYAGHPAYDAEALIYRFLRSASSVVTGGGGDGAAAAASSAVPASPAADAGGDSSGSGSGATVPDALIELHARNLVAEPSATLFVVVDNESGAVAGRTAFLANRGADLVVEIGAVAISPPFQGTAVNTEATMLLLRHAFERGYRRVEWKCNARNERSRAAATRMGFVFEGVFRRHMIVSGVSRDTAWYAVTDEDWCGVGPKLAVWVASVEAVALNRRRAAALAALREAAGAGE